MNKNLKIYVAGGQSGLVGRAIVRGLKAKGFTNIITKTRKQLDLLDQRKVDSFFKKEKPDYVFLAAARVGGILANKTRKGDFIYENLTIQNNVIYGAWKYNVKKLLFLGSSCIYPKLSPQPIKEEYLLTGKLEETNDAYAIAKIAGIKLCQSLNEQYKTNFISVMPCNLYGPYDNFNLETSHVLPALIRKFHGAAIRNEPEVELWGSGNVFREFLYVDDLADACIFLMEKYNDSQIINIGTGKDTTIKQLAQRIKKIIGFKGRIRWDKTKPDGTPRKVIDATRLFKMGWKPKTSLQHGIEFTYDWFKQNYEKIREADSKPKKEHS